MPQDPFHEVERSDYYTNHCCTRRLVDTHRVMASESGSIFYRVGVHLESQGHAANAHGYSYSQIAGDKSALKELSTSFVPKHPECPSQAHSINRTEAQTISPVEVHSMLPTH